MGINVILLFISFSIIAFIGLLSDESRKLTLSRSGEEWTADFAGLFIQGTIIPAVPFLTVPLLTELFPALAGSINLDPFSQFLISFVFVDYLYYWNHRLFHRRHYWPIHRLHHSSRHLDIFATSRNSLITSFLFVYVWSQIIGMYFLKDSTAFMLGLGLTFALDLWRHSGIDHGTRFNQLAGAVFITPAHHVLHHSVTGRTRNYGANLSIWDRLHGTFSNEYVMNNNLEKLSDKNVWKELLFPWKTNK